MPKNQEKDKNGKNYVTLNPYCTVFYLTAYSSRNPHRDPASTNFTRESHNARTIWAN
jgi:hypothetical protein